MGSPPASAAPATDWTKVTTGSSHTCAIRSVGKLYCWGDDAAGQLGNGSGSNADVASPQQITTATDWKTVSAGTLHTCAIRSIGKLYCWGNDGFGRLGNGAGGSTTAPAQITTATDWRAVSAGEEHTCAIRSTGKLYCWGNDDFGKLGNGPATGNVTAPTQITSATDWKTVSAGAEHSCATRGKLYCWGSNGYGQVGNGNSPGSSIPVQITTATDWHRVSADAPSPSCAIRSVGKLYCWGMLYLDTPNNFGRPEQFTSATDWKVVSVDAYEACAIRSIGKLYCWGAYTNESGFAESWGPTQLTSATDWKSVSVGSRACAIRSTGKLYCWHFIAGSASTPTQV